MFPDSVVFVLILGVFLHGANGLFEQRDIFGSRTWDPIPRRPTWQGGLGASLDYPHRYGRFNGHLQYNHNDHLSVRGSGWVDTFGNYGVGASLEYRFKKRAARLPGDQFYLRIDASPCQFLVYDRNTDGIITREEVHDVFPDDSLAEKLFSDLDSTSGDNIITREEFYFMAPKLIYGCDITAPEPAPRETEQPENSESTDTSGGQIDEISEEHTEE